MRRLLVAAVLSACSCAGEQPPVPAGSVTQASPRQLDSLPALLACAKAALGGADALDQVSSILVSVEMRSADSTAAMGTRKLAIEWPDRFLDRRAEPSLPEVAWGITGQTLVSAATVKGKWEVHATRTTSLTSSHKRFARFALMWLLRTSALVPLNLSYIGSEPASPGQVLIAATGPEGFDARLSIDESTCLPTSLTFSRPPTLADETRSKEEALPAVMVEGVELSDYQPAGHIQFPRTMTLMLNGRATGVWRVTDVAINQVLEDFFDLK